MVISLIYTMWQNNAFRKLESSNLTFINLYISGNGAVQKLGEKNMPVVHSLMTRCNEAVQSNVRNEKIDWMFEPCTLQALFMLLLKTFLIS